jgi:WhiB family transcriptional regulator, redox-sensing transcriptional regulator
MATTATSSWWELAACQSADPELFFPMSGIGLGQAEVTRAKQYCGRCGIRQRCLDYAIDSNQAHGIWGGTSEEERMVIAAQRRHIIERISA